MYFIKELDINASLEEIVEKVNEIIAKFNAYFENDGR